MLKIGEKIRELRKSRGLTQEELGELTGTTQSNINMIENGKSNPSYTLLQKIADVLKVDFSYLTGGRAIPLDDPVFYAHYDEETKEFLANPKNKPYIILAEELKNDYNLTEEELESVRVVIKLLKKDRKK